MKRSLGSSRKPWLRKSQAQRARLLLVAFEPRVDPGEKPLPPDRKKKQRRKKKNAKPKTGFDLRRESYKLFGVDLTQIPGLNAMVLPLFGELGRDMSKWPTADHFASWLSLCPDNDISGGRVLWKGMRVVHNRAGDLFRLGAYSLYHDSSPLGDYLRRMKSKLDTPAAITATAHKMAIMFYTMVNKHDASIWAQRDADRERRFEEKLKRQAQQRGYKLVPMEEKPAA